MSENQRMTVTLHWCDQDGEHEHQMHCDDQTPQQLIPVIVDQIGLPTVDRNGDAIIYELHLGNEQRPPLRAREMLSAQNVRYGSDLSLAAKKSGGNQTQRCILRLPDGSEIVIGPRGQALSRFWLLGFLKLHNPQEYRREEERSVHGRSLFTAVARDSHCTICLSDRGYWVVTSERADRVTEWAAAQEFNRVPLGAPIRLDNGMRLRLGGDGGLEITVVLV